MPHAPYSKVSAPGVDVKELPHEQTILDAKSAQADLATVLAIFLSMATGPALGDDAWKADNLTAHPYANMEMKCGTGSWNTFTANYGQTAITCATTLSNVTIRGTNSGGTRHRVQESPMG